MANYREVLGFVNQLVGYGAVVTSIAFQNTELAILGLGTMTVGNTLYKSGAVKESTEKLEQISNQLEKIINKEPEKVETAKK